jgi:inner membrane protein
MTVFEHAMLGASLGLAAGLQKQYGWRVVGMAAAVGAMPDWDGLSILLGPESYARAHRVWGHNLLLAGAGGLIVAWLEYRYCVLTRAAQAIARRLPGLVLPSKALEPPEQGKSPSALGAWLALGLTASYSHLLADYFYSGHPTLHTWGLPLLWPFSTQTWAWPTIAWGDLGATLIFVVEMFALYRWPGRARPIACLALIAVVAYVAIHALLDGSIS